MWTGAAVKGFLFFFFKQKTAYEIMPSLVGSEMCIRDRYCLISSDVRIAPGAVIGDRVLVAMGAVVSGRLEQHSQLYAGVPARPIRSLALDADYWPCGGGVFRVASQAGF